MSTSNVWSAVIAAVTALVVFVLTQLVTGRRERRTQRDERRRAALADVQDAALRVRNDLGRYGPLARRATGAAPGTELVAAERALDDSFARLDVLLTRVDDGAVRSAIETWRERARFHYVSAEEVTTAEEHALWTEMNAAIGAALTARDAR